MGKIILFESGGSKGTRGTSYEYVIEDRRLVPLRDYINRGTLDKIINREIAIFDFSRSGIGGFSVVTVEAVERISYPYSGYILHTAEELARGDMKDAVAYFKGYEFDGLTPSVKELADELNSFFSKLVDDVNGYFRRFNARLFFGGHARRVEEAFNKGVEVAVFSALTIENNRGRLNSLRGLRKWIYQIWVLKEMLNALGTHRFYIPRWRDEPYIDIQQGQTSPTCVAYTDSGAVTFWLEFQPHKAIHLVGMVDGRRHHLRPDIVAVKGEYMDAKELEKIDLIVECKDDRVESKDLNQVTGYINNYAPGSVMLVSLKEVPHYLRRRFEDAGATVIDGFSPTNQVAMDVFRQLLKNYFHSK